MIVVDTSVAVATALPWHEAHANAVAALPRAKTALLAQVAVETYSVLTRLPPPQRVSADIAHAYLRETYAFPPLVLTRAGHDKLLARAAGESIVGGAVYDALVAAAAREARATLLTLDRRAVPTYERMGVQYRLIV
jgi:predicted nucleic acid-binding protein